jgi:hypothetical protein
MPITIGSQTDVPDAGDPIVSPWYQDTAKKLVHHFPSIAARNGWTTRPAGAMAVTTDTDQLWMWDGAAWIEYARADKALSDTGLVSLTLSAGWGGVLTMRRYGTTVGLNFVVSRSGGNLSSSLQWIATIDPGAARPTLQWEGIMRMSNPVDQARVQVGTDGGVRFPAITINTGSLVFGSMAWPAGTL